jgi:adenine-specific DNA-methyltransferase
MPRGKLELTWVGKDERPRLEPRVLVEDPSKSYGDPNSENMLIFGDNLLALKALEQDFAGRIKCIYIDPPYNTGSAFTYYGKSRGRNKRFLTWASPLPSAQAFGRCP